MHRLCLADVGPAGLRLIAVFLLDFKPEDFAVAVSDRNVANTSDSNHRTTLDFNVGARLLQHYAPIKEP